MQLNALKGNNMMDEATSNRFVLFWGPTELLAEKALFYC